MTAAPNGQSKAADENQDAVANAAAEKPRAQRTKAEQTKIDKAIASKPHTNTDAKAKVTTGGARAEKDPLPKAEPEAVSHPSDNAAPAQEDNATPTGAKRTPRDPAKEGPKTFDVAPATAGPNDLVPEGEVQVTRKAEEGELSDPAGNVTKTVKTGKARAPKKDSLKEITDLGKLPVAVTVGQLTASVEEYAGRPVLSLSLVGWVGDAPLKILAADIGELEQAISELRSQLS